MSLESVMFSKPKTWLPGGIWRPKNPHSLEHLKYLHNVLCKNQAVTEQNKSLLVETLRSISEILIWGDQNDSSVFDFFLEKNMLAFFLRFMRQKTGRYICVQLLQTLNILFENISNETSVYYLLSNNHINSIIVHKFDFSDEEVMAYYISFLKTLSLKLNKHTIHFFYNEHTNDFALYTEAIKFFNHSESMVRIAVRTITLNVYKACQFSVKYDKSGRPKVDDKSMLRYIRDKTAAPYFSNLVWFIGNHILELDSCVRHDADHNSRDRLADLVAEHLDHLHYLNDILCLSIDALNEVLTDHLLNRLLIPLYVYSLTKRKKYAPRSNVRPHVSSVVSLFLLSQVFLIISHAPLVRQLADIIFNGDIEMCMGDKHVSPQLGKRSRREFRKPSEPLAQTLESNRGKPRKTTRRRKTLNTEPVEDSRAAEATEAVPAPSSSSEAAAEAVEEEEGTVPEEEGQEAQQADGEYPVEVLSPGQNSTDEEKLLISGSVEQRQTDFSLNNRPYLEAVFNALECSENDYEALFALCLLYAMGHNKGINQELLDMVLMPTNQSEAKEHYNVALVEKLIRIISNSCQNGSKVRLATLEMSILLLKQLVYQPDHCYLQDRHLACLEGAREEATLLLRNFYKVWEKSEEIFLDMFEDEFREMQSRPLNVEYLMMDSSILLQPTGTPLTGIDFNKRLPCGEVERARRAIRVFFHLRDLSLTLRGEAETQLPLTRLDECVKVSDVLDLNNSDLIACTVITRDNKKERRFLVIDVLQLILVEPDTRRLGWGVVKFVGFLQDVEVTGDKDDSRSLHVTIHKPSMNIHAKPIPLLSARFVFDDHIRCMAAKQRLSKGRLKARQRKMQMIARLLELPTHVIDTMYQPSTSYATSATSLRGSTSSGAIPGRAAAAGRSERQGRPQSEVVQRSLFSLAGQGAGTTEPDTVLGTTQPAAQAQVASARTPAQTDGATSEVQEGSIGHGELRQPQLDEASTPQGSQLLGEVEQAEEAQPSPPKDAAQYLSQQPPQQQATPPTARHVRSGSGSSTGSQDIPLEDMSKKSKPTHPSISKIAARRSLSDESSDRTRSSSYSPARSRSGSSSPGRRTPIRRSRALSESSQGSPTHSSSKGRAGSHASPKRSTKSPGRKGSGLSVTSFTTKPGSDPAEDLFPEKSKEVVASSVSGLRTRSGSGPKSLTPASQPPLSLVTEPTPTQHSSGLGSPKLMPPVADSEIRHVVETHSTENQTDRESGAMPLPGETQKPVFHFNSKGTAVVDTTNTMAVALPMDRQQQTTATDQLTRLAQIVQEHYSFAEDSSSLEMAAQPSPNTQAAHANVTDEDKEQAAAS